jgi:hypothetical protein
MMLGFCRARFIASRLPRSALCSAGASLVGAVAAAPQGLCGGPPLLAARGVRTAWAPHAPPVRPHGGAVSVSGRSVCARRSAGSTAPGNSEPDEAGESQSSVTATEQAAIDAAAEKAAIDSAAEKMAQRATERLSKWDETLFWEGIDSWAKFRRLGRALGRRLREIGVPAAKTDQSLADEFRGLAVVDDATEFDLLRAQDRVAVCVRTYRRLLPPPDAPQTFLEVFTEKVKNKSFTKLFELEGPGRDWGSRVLVINMNSTETKRVVKCGKVAVNSQFVTSVQSRLSHESLVVVTGESGAGKTFGAVMAAAQSARVPGAEDTRNAIVLYFSSFEDVRAIADASHNLGSRTDSDKEAFDRQVLDLVERAVCKTLEELKLPRDETDSDGRRVVVVLDELGSRRDVLRALCAMHAKLGVGGRDIASLSKDMRAKFHCGPVYFVAVGTGCDTALWQAGSCPDSYSTVAATPASGREVFRGIIAAEAMHDTRADIRRRAGSICGLDDSHDVAPTTHAWSAIGHALVGNARVAALVARGIVSDAMPATSDLEATLEVEMRVVLIKSMREFVKLNALKTLSVIQRNQAVAQAAALMFGATDADLPEDLEENLCVRYGIVTSNAVRVNKKKMQAEQYIALKAEDGVRTLQGSGDDVVCVPKVKPRYSVSPALLVMLLLSFGHSPHAATGMGFEHAIQDAIAVCVPAVIAARKWALSFDERFRKLAIPSRRATRLHIDPASAARSGPAPTMHPFFEVLYAAAKAKSIATMRRWVRGSAAARLEPTKFDTDETAAKAHVKAHDKATIKTTAEPTKHLRFVEWLKLLGASVTDMRQLPDAAVVLNGQHASGPDIVALFCPHFSPDKLESAAAVFVQCKNHQTPETDKSWQESVLAVLDEYVKMGAPAFRLPLCKAALELNEKDMQKLSAPKRSTWRSQGPEAPKPPRRRFALNPGAARRGKNALGEAAAGAYFVVVQCRALSAHSHAKGGEYDMKVEHAVCAILKAHAAVEESHARCFYIRTYPGDERLAPVDIAKEGGGGGVLISDTGVDAQDDPGVPPDPQTSAAPMTGEKSDSTRAHGRHPRPRQ